MNKERLERKIKFDREMNEISRAGQLFLDKMAAENEEDKKKRSQKTNLSEVEWHQ